MNKKRDWKTVLRYKFDNLMSKGAVALVGILFLATTIVVVLTGVLVFVFGQGSIRANIWQSIMHVIDAGTITAADTANVPNLILMSVVTLCGIFITSILIGIITTGFEEKLNTLKKGNSMVVESGHTLVLGFNDSVYTILSELIEANANQKDGCIVILTPQDKEEVETEIAKNILDFKTTRIICRTGSITDVHMLQQCSIDTCRAIIINEQEDFTTTKAILAIVSFFKSRPEIQEPAHVVATISDDMNYEAAKIAGEGNAELILVNDAVSRIIAQTCRQPGLSNVLVELFDYDGNELYFETFPSLAGKKFGDILNSFEMATPMGIRRDKAIFINPDNDFVLESNDDVLLLVEDDGMAKPLSNPISKPDIEPYVSHDIVEVSPDTVLILGTNALLEQILLQLDEFFLEGSTVILADENVDTPELKELSKQLKQVRLETVSCDTNLRSNLETLVNGKIDHVLLLSADDCDTERSDAMTLLKLIHLRDIAQKQDRLFSITSELKNITNQRLAQVAEVNDLVVGSNIVNLILTQVSENRDLSRVFKELLQQEGSEIYIRKAAHYVQLHKEMDFYTVTEIVKQKNEIAMGYKMQRGKSFEIVTSPLKSEVLSFGEDDYIIVLAED